MSGTNSQGNYSRYDEMTTPQLQDICWKHAHDELETELDIDELLYITKVLDERSKEQGVTGLRTNEEAWAIFEEHYMPQSAKRSLKREAWRSAHPHLRRFIASAAVLVLLITLPISAKALKLDDLWDVVAMWAKETFSFVSGGSENIDAPDDQYRDQSCELQELLASCNHRADIVPTWVPVGFVFEKVEQDITPVQEVYRASYLNGNEVIRIRIQTYFAEGAQNTEVEDGWREVYTVSGVDYYIFENLEQVQVVWVVDSYECIISGDLSVDEAKEMINSIGKG